MLLYVRWYSYMNAALENSLNAMGIDYEIFHYQFKDWEKDEVYVSELTKKLDSGKYDRVFTVNFNPLTSDVCEKKGILYIFWVYDSPIHIRDISSLKNSCNRGYFFDRGQVEDYRRCGIEAFHMPLAGDPKTFAPYIKDAGKNHHDISFVGQLYMSEYNHYMQVLDEYDRGYIEALVKTQGQIYGAYFLDKSIDDALIGRMNERYAKASNGKVKVEKREIEFLLAKEITSRERKLALALLSKKHEVTVYSPDHPDNLSGVKFKEPVAYIPDMPAIFASSDINLNISLKTIKTGIPLRVFDILSCGGFCITNYSEELTEYFAIGQEIECYENIPDLYEKCTFYLAHPDIREKIAKNGYECIGKYHTFLSRLSEMLKQS